MVYRQAGPPRRIDWSRVAGCAFMVASAVIVLGTAWLITVLVLSSGRP